MQRGWGQARAQHFFAKRLARLLRAGQGGDEAEAARAADALAHVCLGQGHRPRLTMSGQKRAARAREKKFVSTAGTEGLRDPNRTSDIKRTEIFSSGAPLQSRALPIPPFHLVETGA